MGNRRAAAESHPGSLTPLLQYRPQAIRALAFTAELPDSPVKHYVGRLEYEAQHVTHVRAMNELSDQTHKTIFISAIQTIRGSLVVTIEALRCLGSCRR